MTTAIKVENLSKAYQIGQIGTGTISRDIERWFITKVMKKEDPFLKLGETNDRTKRSETNVVWSLKDINLEIEQGDAVGIIGRNGAGKSTLLKLLSRVTAPTTGSIKIKGRVASLLEVGTGFHPELTGRENIYLNGSILGMRKREIDRKLDEIVDFSGVERYIDTPVKRYSSGMSVRLAFAVAAHLESEILIVDEVLAVGDAEFQKKCLGKMEEVAVKGRTVLFVSHNLGAVRELCRGAILIQNGCIRANGLINDVIPSYLKSIEETSEADLLIRTDRKGKGFTRLKKVEISNCGTAPAGDLTTGMPSTLKFLLTEGLQDPQCTFTIYDHLGNAVANFNSNIKSSRDFRGSSISSEIICQIDELPLVPGKYRINVAISSNGVVQDHIEGAGTFTVQAGSFDDRQVNRDIGFGRTCIKHRWYVP